MWESEAQSNIRMYVFAEAELKLLSMQVDNPLISHLSVRLMTALLVLILLVSGTEPQSKTGGASGTADGGIFSRM